jgi:hypothetical protein
MDRGLCRSVRAGNLPGPLMGGRKKEIARVEEQTGETPRDATCL